MYCADFVAIEKTRNFHKKDLGFPPVKPNGGGGAWQGHF